MYLVNIHTLRTPGCYLVCMMNTNLIKPHTRRALQQQCCSNGSITRVVRVRGNSRIGNALLLSGVMSVIVSVKTMYRSLLRGNKSSNTDAVLAKKAKMRGGRKREKTEREGYEEKTYVKES